MELKEKLVALRKEKGLTQLAVAEKLDVSRQAISRWESGIAQPSTDSSKSVWVCDILNIVIQGITLLLDVGNSLTAVMYIV